MWEEIHGFATPGEYVRFLGYLDQLVAAFQAVEVPVDQEYGRGEIYGGRWFRDVESGAVWRLVPPDPPFRGLWEPVQTPGKAI